MPAFALTEFAVVHTANEKVVAGFQQKERVHLYSLFLFCQYFPCGAPRKDEDGISQNTP